GRLGSTSAVIVAALGTRSGRRPRCFPGSWANIVLIPVTLPPGRFMLATRPVTLLPGRFMLATRPQRTGSAMMTIGIGEARTCCTSASNAGKAPKTITPTFRSSDRPIGRTGARNDHLRSGIQQRNCGLRHSQRQQGRGEIDASESADLL